MQATGAAVPGDQLQRQPLHDGRCSRGPEERLDGRGAGVPDVGDIGVELRDLTLRGVDALRLEAVEFGDGSVGDQTGGAELGVDASDRQMRDGRIELF